MLRNTDRFKAIPIAYYILYKNPDCG